MRYKQTNLVRRQIRERKKLKDWQQLHQTSQMISATPTTFTERHDSVMAKKLLID